MTPDKVNALFELGGSLLIWLNVRRLYRDKIVRGVSIPVAAFYTAWGMWNVIYYPAIGQWLSFYAGIGVMLGNAAWVVLACVYTLRERKPRGTPLRGVGIL